MTYFATQNPLFQPAMRIISSITKGNITSFQTSFAHQYTTGLIVRIVIPKNWGMQEINQQYGPITVTGADTFSMVIDSTNYTDLTPPLSVVEQNSVPQVVPIGEINSQLSQATHNVFG